jgi:hypothetical protein
LLQITYLNGVVMPDDDAPGSSDSSSDEPDGDETSGNDSGGVEENDG